MDYITRIEVEMEAGSSAVEAMRTILLPLLEVLVATEEGAVLADSDSLHDFRVATRRTRSALGQIRGVFRRQATAPFRSGFAWLGEVTGPARDLDVLFEDLPVYRESASEAARSEFETLESCLRSRHGEALAGVRQALGGRRYRRLVSSWRRFLDDPPPGVLGKRADRPAREVASRSLRRAHRRLLERGAAITPESTSVELHRLRIAGKKLRYLLEFFRGLYPPENLERPIAMLKRVQDTLGALNDCAVQRRLIEGAAARLAAEGSAVAPAVGAFPSALEALEERSLRERRQLIDTAATLAALPQPRL